MLYSSIAKIYYLNGHTIDSIGGLAATNSGVTFTMDKAVSPLVALDNGYYLNTLNNQIIDPQYIQTTETLFEGGEFHNLIKSYIRFPLAGFFDRSNVTIWNDTARLGYYDSLNPTDFHIDELNITTIDSYFNQSYKERFYQQFKESYCYKDFLNSLMLYATQKTLLDAIKVHKYIGNECQLLTDNGVYLYSNNLPIWVQT
jgi:hypothetical protein